MSIDKKLAECGAFLYDLEIICAVPMRGEPRKENLYYCKGWEDYEGMGISVVTAYDFAESSYRIYLEDNLSDLRTIINSRGVIIGFNNNRFDNNVLSANGIHIPKQKSYDLWEHIVNSVPDGQGARRGYSLQNMLDANGLQAKSGLGAQAPIWAQNAQWGRLISYCLDDTKLELQLLRLACADLMKSPKTGEYMNIKKPWELECVETGGIFS